MTIGTSPQVAVILEPREGGRLFERGEDGSQTQWGKVLAWSPPDRIVVAWQINAAFKYDPNLVTELEFSFTPEGNGTLVAMEHRNLERIGVDAAKVAEMLRGGWPGVLASYVAYASAGLPAG